MPESEPNSPPILVQLFRVRERRDRTREKVLTLVCEFDRTVLSLKREHAE